MAVQPYVKTETWVNKHNLGKWVHLRSSDFVVPIYLAELEQIILVDLPVSIRCTEGASTDHKGRYC